MSLKNPQMRQHWIDHMIRTYLPNALLNCRAVFDLLARLLQDETEQILFVP